MKALPTPREAGRLYDALYRRASFHDAPRFYRWVLAKAAPGPGGRILDIGCGTGELAREAAALGLEAWGVDISREALARARACAPRAHLVLADGARLPFATGSFLHVFNLGNLEHFTYLDEGIRELRRVLAPGGMAWVLLPNLYYSGTLWRVVCGGGGPDHHQPIDRFATRSEWRELLEAGGLRVIHCIPYHRGKWWKRLLPATLAWHFLFGVRSGEPTGLAPLQPLARVRPIEAPSGQ